MQDVATSDLICRIAQYNDEKALRQLFELYYPRLLQLAHLILKNNEAAEDAVLEIFARIWEMRTSLREIENLDRYLYVMVKNHSLKHLRKDKDLIQASIDKAPYKEVLHTQHPEQAMLDDELGQIIDEAVLNLPEKCRIVFRLVKEEGHTYKEAAELLSVSYKTIDNHLNLAMNRIRGTINSYRNNNDSVKWRVIKGIIMACFL
jgi:RNA polymerase sigma-70 factor (ECF subfamily)